MGHQFTKNKAGHENENDPHCSITSCKKFNQEKCWIDGATVKICSVCRADGWKQKRGDVIECKRQSKYIDMTNWTMGDMETNDSWTKELKNDERRMMRLVKKNGLYLKNIDPTILTRDIVIEAVTQNGFALEFASTYINDFDVVLAAVKNEPLAYFFAGKKIRKKIEFLLEVRKICHRNPIPSKSRRSTRKVNFEQE